MRVPNTSIAVSAMSTMIRYCSPYVSDDSTSDAATSAIAKTRRFTASFCRSASRTVTHAMAKTFFTRASFAGRSLRACT